MARKVSCRRSRAVLNFNSPGTHPGNESILHPSVLISDRKG